MAFQNVAIETVVLPDNIQNIPGNPFCGCVKLSSFTLENSAFFQLIDNVLYSKDGKKMISYPLASDAKKYTVKPGTEIIVPYAFYGAQNLKEVIIPEGVTRLGLFNFYSNNVIEKIYLPMSLNIIEEGAFSKCDNLTVYCYEGSYAHTYAQENNIPFIFVGGKCGEDANWIYNDGVLMIEGKGDISDYNWQNLEARPWHSFSSSIHSIIIRSGITRIGESCFESFTALTSVSIPNTVNLLAFRSFFNCSSLTHISLPNALTGIAGASFYDCKSLTEIVIPDSVTWLGFGVFGNCVSLTRVHLSNQLSGISYLEFDGCTKLTEIEIPRSVTYIGHNAFSNCPLLATIIIPPSVTQIDVSTHDEESFDPTFYHSENITIYCYKDSTAHTYAQENNIPFVLLPTFN